MWKDRIKKLFSRRIHSVLGIDIGTETIKIVEVGWKNGKAQLKGVSVTEIPEQLIDDGLIIDQTALEAVIKKTIETSGFKARDVVAAVGGRSVYMREIMFPIMKPEELREAIKWDMEEYVPYAPDTYYFDFSVIGPGKTDMEQRILLVAVPKDRIDALVAVLKNVGLVPIAIDIESLALYRTIDDAKNSVMVDIGGAVSQVTIYQDGCPVVSRAIPIAGQQFTGAIMSELGLDFSEAERLKIRQAGLLLPPEEFEARSPVNEQLELLVDDFIKEFRRTLEYYQMQNKNALIDKVFITGGASKLTNLNRHLTAKVGLPIILHNPLLVVENAAALEESFLQEISLQLSVAIGLALRGGEV